MPGLVANAVFRTPCMRVLISRSKIWVSSSGNGERIKNSCIRSTPNSLGAGPHSKPDVNFLLHKVRTNYCSLVSCPCPPQWRVQQPWLQTSCRIIFFLPASVCSFSPRRWILAWHFQSSRLRGAVASPLQIPQRLLLFPLRNLVRPRAAMNYPPKAMQRET